MKRLISKFIPVLMIIGAISLISWAASSPKFSVFESRGVIADDQRELFIFVSLLSLLVIIPVFSLTAFIAWRYRESNNKSNYSPNWEGSRVLEAIWWLVPAGLIGLLSVIIWQSSHRLDPFKPISSNKEPLVVQVIAMEWKWLFIYPEEDIATVNELYMPVDRPLELQLTADAPMSAIWIPQLGGQIYAMSGMRTKLNLEAREIGVYNGLSTNINGEGFAGMTFKAHAVKNSDFDNWVAFADSSEVYLNDENYEQLSEQSQNNPVSYYSGSDNIFTKVLARYAHIGPKGEAHH